MILFCLSADTRTIISLPTSHCYDLLCYICKTHRLENLYPIFDMIKLLTFNHFHSRLYDPVKTSSISQLCTWTNWLRLRKWLVYLIRKVNHVHVFYVLLPHTSSLYGTCVHVQIIHILFQITFIFRSAFVWSWWISLPRSRDLHLPELAVWWGPWLPWWFRRVFRCLWVARLSSIQTYLSCEANCVFFSWMTVLSCLFYPSESLRNLKPFSSSLSVGDWQHICNFVVYLYKGEKMLD